MEKKSERLEVRLGYQEKQDFTQACDLQGDTPSGAIRRFMNGYVKRSDRDVLASVWRQSGRRKILPMILALGVICAFAGIYILSLNSPSKATADEIFEFRDRNGDGELEYSEHGLPPEINGEPNGVLKVLDLDSSGTISRAEFVDKGKMVFARATPGQVKKDPRMTLVEFEFWKEKADSGTYSNAKVNAYGIDRLVVWPEEDGKGPVIVEGRVEIQSGLDGELNFTGDIITHHKD